MTYKEVTKPIQIVGVQNINPGVELLLPNSPTVRRSPKS
jgi:hypothetical protein